MAVNKLPEGQFQISDGPSKFDLMASLFEAKVVQITCEVTAITSSNLKVAASFKVLPRFKVIFQMVGAEDGSLDSWIGEVYFVEPSYENVSRKFYYNSKKRTGHIREFKR